MRKVLRISLYVLGSIVLLVFIAVLFIISPPGKKFVRDQAVSFLRNKLKTEVHIGAVEYSLPKMVGLRDVLFKDQARDTLLAARRLKVDIDMLALLKSRVVVEEIVLEGVNAHIYRNAPDTTFNYSYIIEAFAPASPAPATKEVAATPQDTSAALVFDLDRVLLDDIRLRFNDQTGGMNLALALNQLRLNMRTLDPDKMVFDLKRLYVNGLDVNFIQDSSLLPPSAPDTAAQPLRLAADQIELHHITTNFEDRLNNMLLDLNLGSLRAQARSFDLLAQQIDIPKLHIDSTRLAMILGRASDVPACST